VTLENHVIHLEGGRMAADTPRAVVQRIARDAATRCGPGGIVLHFHGGLVDHAAGVAIARRLAPVYRDAAGAYPVFFVWESGLLETLQNNLAEIAREKFFRMVWKRIAGIVMRKFRSEPGQRTGLGLPPVDASSLADAIDAALDRGAEDALPVSEPAPPVMLEELTSVEKLSLEQELAVDAELTLEIEQVSAGLRLPDEVEADRRARSARVPGSTRTLMDPDALAHLVDRPTPGARGLVTVAKLIEAVVSVAAGVIRRFLDGRDHGFHATVVEEILRELYLANAGGAVWGWMKGDTQDAFRDDATVYGGTAFLEALRDAVDPNNPPRITLVGHSTGAVFISEFLDKAAGILPPAQPYDVVFLAPAATCERTAATLQAHHERIRGFRMFTMTDAYEREDRLVPVLYPHSLLYFVSGVVEGSADTPIVGMHRFYDDVEYPDGAFPSVRIVRDFVRGGAGRAVWAVTVDGPAGQRSASQRHVDFDDDEVTLQSVAHLLEAGF
jgi:hypothetical protein